MTETTGSTLLMRNGQTLFWGVGGKEGNARGFMVALLTDDGQLWGAVQTFDVLSTVDTDQAEADRLLAHLASVPNGTLLAVGIADDAGITFGRFGPDAGDPVVPCDTRTPPSTNAIRAQFRAFGSQLIGEYCYRDSWAFATRVGTGVALKEAHESNAPATIHLSLD
jgi:hypothetical protein